MIIESYRELFFIILQTVCIFVVYFLLYRRYIYSLFDPLFFFLITQAFSVELAILQINDLRYLINFISCQALFTVGFIIFSNKIKNISTIDNSRFYFSKKGLLLLKKFNFLGVLLILCVNLYFFFQKGVILLSDDPSVSKVTDFEGGLGFVKRINWSLLNLIPLISFFLYIYLGKKRYIFYIFILLLISISGGSKGTLLNYLYIISMLSLFKKFKVENYLKTIKRLRIPVSIVSIFIALYIFSTNSSNFEETIYAVGIRFLYFGDIILYYYTPDSVKHFQQLGFLDFLNYEFNGILGFIRVVPYVTPLGAVMVSYSLPANQYLDIVVGPNAPFYVKGHVFFGEWGALIYSIFIGSIVGYFRKHLFKMDKKEENYLLVILILFINTQVFNYPQDSGLLLSTFFDALFFSMIILLPAYLLTKVNVK